MAGWPPGSGDGDDGEGPPGGDPPGDGVADNLIVLPGLARLPEPSPRRDGGPQRPPPEEGEDGLERLEPAEAPPAHLLDAAVEALLFAASEPMTETKLDGFLGNPGVAEVRAALLALRVRYEGRGGGIRLVQVAHGWQLRTDPRFGRWVTAMLGGKPMRLSRAALEVLSIVAYRQPVTKAEIDDLRGVDSGGVLRMLVERGLAQVCGRRDEPGRPLMYGSTSEFLSLFGLRDLSDLPTLRDLHELQHDDPRLGPLHDGPMGQMPLPLEVEPVDELEGADPDQPEGADDDSEDPGLPGPGPRWPRREGLELVPSDDDE